MNQPQPFKPSPLTRLENASRILRAAGLSLPGPAAAEKPIVSLLREIAPLGEAKTAVIAKTLSSLEDFNELVRSELVSSNAGAGYAKIADLFDSIREDSRRQIEQMADGKIDFSERIANHWTRLRHGSIPNRFEKIKAEADGVFNSTERQLSGERAILTAYSEVRLGVKEASILAADLRDTANQDLENSQEALRVAQERVDALDAQAADRPGLEVRRDEAIATTQQSERRYQVALDLANNLSIAYNTGDVVMARLTQMTEAKQRVLQQSVSFMSTNDGVMTALAATLTATNSLHASTQTLDQLKDGANRALDTLADVGGQVTEAAVRAGHAPTIRAENLGRLVDSIVDFQVRSREFAAAERAAAVDNEQEIRRIVEAGRQRLAALAIETARSNPSAGVDTSPQQITHQP